jgi:hypothetical protein
MKREGGRAGLTKCDGEQARAQHNKADRSQREESIGHEVMIAHGAPAGHDAGPNLLKMSESAVLQKAGDGRHQGTGAAGERRPVEAVCVSSACFARLHSTPPAFKGRSVRAETE